MTDQAEKWREQQAAFRVGAYRVEPRGRRISKEGVAVRVEPKVMDVLLCMADRPGDVVTKDEFMERVWGDTVVTDDALLRCISELRKVFDDDARAPRFIETIRSQGYRLIAPVTRPDVDTSSPSRRQDQSRTEVIEEAEDAGIVSAARRVARRPRAWAAVLAALVLLTAAFVSLREIVQGPAPPPAPLKAAPLTSLPGEEVDPALSPDGYHVAFAWKPRDAADFDLYLKQVGVATPYRLTQHPAEARYPAFSPDGQRIAFVRSTDTTSTLFVTPVVGGHPRKVKTLDVHDVRGLAWAPDGQTLAFSARAAPYSAFRLFLFSLETREARPLTTPPADYRGDFMPAFSPDESGSLLTFKRSIVYKIADIFVIPVKGGEPKRLTADNALITGLDWAPKGHEVIFTSDRAGGLGLWRVDASGGTPTWIATTEGGAVHHPAIARQSGALAYVRRSDETNIWAQPLSAPHAAPHPLIASTRWDSHPHLSPDGSRVTFVSNRTGSDEVWIAGADGAPPRRLTHFNGHVTTSPRFSPSGERIAFVSRQEESAHIYVIDAAGGPPHRLTHSSANDKAPRWSRGGRWIYFASDRTGHWQIWKIASDGSGEAVQVTENGGFAALEGPEGKYLFYVKRNEPGIWRRSLGGGPEVRVVEHFDPLDWANFAVTTEGLYFVRRSADAAPALVFRSFETGEERILTRLDGLLKHPSLTISADGQRVLFAREDRSESDLLFVKELQ